MTAVLSLWQKKDERAGIRSGSIVTKDTRLYNFLIVGYGSMGKRHIKNLKDILSDSVMIDILRREESKPVDFKDVDSELRFLFSGRQLRDYYDAIFITNPTSLHYETLKKYRHLSNAFFIEKPVFISGEEDMNDFISTGKMYYVACPLRYSNVIQWLKCNIDFSSVHSIRVISSSYLPDWRPGSDYRDAYSAHKDMGGGVSIDLIHEWDYICYLIGFPQSVQSIIGKKSSLEIDSDDIALYIGEYADKVVEVHLDYFGRKPVRRIELFTEDDTIVADLIEQRITWLCSEKKLDLWEDRDSYQKKELRHFMDILEGRLRSDNGIEEACRVLRIARGVV